MESTGWLEDRWRSLTDMGAGAWVAWAVWVALLLGVVVLVYVHRQIQRNRHIKTEQTRPHVAMFMEPHAADWHVIELVARNFGQTPAYDVSFAFAHPPSVAQYETAADGYADVIPLQLPGELPVLAPGQEWRTVWDSAIDRGELGDAIESHFSGTVAYFDRPERPRGWRFWQRAREPFETKVVLDWNDLPPVQRLDLMTTHDLAKREKQKLELLRGLLTYFHYASKETRPEVFRAEIDRINRAARETQDRWRSSQHDEPTDVNLRWGDTDANTDADAGKHHS